MRWLVGITASIRDPVLGELHWLEATPQWRGTIWFTPKHEIALCVLDPLTLHNEARPDLALIAARSAYLSHRRRQWDYRLDAAATLLERGRIGDHEELTDLARRLRLLCVILHLDGISAWWCFRCTSMTRLSPSPSS